MLLPDILLLQILSQYHQVLIFTLTRWEVKHPKCITTSTWFEKQGFIYLNEETYEWFAIFFLLICEESMRGMKVLFADKENKKPLLDNLLLLTYWLVKQLQRPNILVKNWFLSSYSFFFFFLLFFLKVFFSLFCKMKINNQWKNLL